MNKNLIKINIFAILLVIFMTGNSIVKAQGIEMQGLNKDQVMQTRNIDKDSANDYQNMMNQYRDFDGNSKMNIMKNFAPALAGLGIFAGIIGIALLAFWIWMLVHAIKHDIDYKPVWILVLWFMNILGAIVYYFAVKRQCPCCEEWCYCEDGKCDCDCDNTCNSHIEEKEGDKVEETKEEVKND